MLIMMRFSHYEGHADHGYKDYDEYRNAGNITGKTGHQ